MSELEFIHFLHADQAEMAKLLQSSLTLPTPSKKHTLLNTLNGSNGNGNVSNKKSRWSEGDEKNNQKHNHKFSSGGISGISNSSGSGNHSSSIQKITNDNENTFSPLSDKAMKFKSLVDKYRSQWNKEWVEFIKKGDLKKIIRKEQVDTHFFSQ